MWHNLTAWECAAQAQAGSGVAETEGSTRASGGFCSGSPASSALQSHPIPSLSPVPLPAAATTKSSRLTFVWLLFGVGWRGQPSGTSRSFSLPLPGAGAGGFDGRMLSPPGHAAELMSSHPPRNEHRLALAGSPRLAATASRKELIFTDTFSPNKVVFGGDDTSRLRTQQPGRRRGGSARGGGQRALLLFSLPCSSASTYFSKFSAPLCVGRVGGKDGSPALAAGRGGSLPPTTPRPGAPQHSQVPRRGCSSPHLPTLVTPEGPGMLPRR